VQKLSADTARLIGQLYESPPFWQAWLTADHSADVFRQIEETKELATIPHLCTLLYRKSDDARMAAGAISAILPQSTSEDYLWLDEEVRYFLNCLQGPVSTEGWPAVLDSPLPQEDRAAAIGVLSCHPRGHIRQKAVEALGFVEDSQAIPFLVLRLNDWVAQVRDASRVAVIRHLNRGELDGFQQHLPLIMRLSNCGRDKHDEIVGRVLDSLSRHDHRSLVNGVLQSSSKDVRHSGYRRLLLRPGLDVENIIQSAFATDDPVLRLWSVKDALVHLQQTELEKLLDSAKHDKFAPVRREALAGYIAKAPGTAESELRNSLLDRSAAVRDFARFWLAKSGQLDFAGYYRKIIHESGPIAAALAGLSETGSPVDIVLFRRFLSAKSSRLREVAVRAIGRISGDEGAQDLLGALQDESKRVSNAAKHALMTKLRRLTLNDLEPLLGQTVRQHARRAALALIDSIGSWKIVPLLITLATDSDETLAAEARRLVLRRVNRVYTSPNQQERTRIEEALQVCEANDQMEFASECRTWIGAFTK
jgi:HEAT repeat protein